MAASSADRKYYAGWIETAPRGEIKALQERKLRQQVGYIFANSPFWNEQFHTAGITLEVMKAQQEQRQSTAG